MDWGAAARPEQALVVRDGRVERVATTSFLVPLLAVLLLITVFPPVVTWLPNLVMGRP